MLALVAPVTRGAQLCWRAAPLSRPEAASQGPADEGRVFGRREAVVAATFGSLPALGVAADRAHAEEPPAPPAAEDALKEVKEDLKGLNLAKKEGAFEDVRIQDIEISDLKRSMSDKDYFEAVMKLNPLQRYLVLEGSTEKPKSGKTVNGYKWDNTEQGVYASAISGATVFSSGAKYDAGTGHASFWAPVDAKAVVERWDVNDKRLKDPTEWRVQVVDRISKTHLGHVFKDESQPSGKRYRINVGALRFVPGPAPAGDVQQAAAGWAFK